MNALLMELISLVTVDGIRLITQRVEESLRKPATLRIGYLNAQVCAVVRSQKNALSFLKSCDVLLPDGAPVAWLARCITRRHCEKITVTDLLPSVLKTADAKGSGILVLGASTAVHQAFIAMCAKQYPRLSVSGLPFDVKTGDAQAVASAIKAIEPDVLLIALGAPFQENFLATYGTGLEPRIVITCGGAIDVISGMKKRAPRWTHSIGIEWIYRIIREPRRLFWRYLTTNAIFLGMSISVLFHCLTGAGRSRK